MTTSIYCFNWKHCIVNENGRKIMFFNSLFHHQFCLLLILFVHCLCCSHVYKLWNVSLFFCYYGSSLSDMLIFYLIAWGLIFWQWHMLFVQEICLKIVFAYSGVRMPENCKYFVITIFGDFMARIFLFI